MQVKKPAVRETILEAAARLFAAEGYSGATMGRIAAAAGLSTGNLYVYFRSKLEVLYAIYEPWLKARLETVHAELRALDGASARIDHLLGALWRDIPHENHRFAVNIMQAVSTAKPGEGYDPALLHWAEAKVAAMLRDALPGVGERATELARIAMMAFDGFAVNARTNPGAPCSEATIMAFRDLLLASPGAS